MAWTYDLEDVKKEIGGGFLNRSGCYEAKLTKLKHNDNKTGSKSFIVGFETTEGFKKDVYITHTKANGESIDFNVRKLNHLCYLLKTKPEAIENIDLEKNEAKIGIFVKVKPGTTSKYPDVDIEGFYDVKSKKVPKELAENSPAVTYGKFEKKYEKDVAIEVKSATTKATSTVELAEDDEEFPF